VTGGIGLCSIKHWQLLLLFDNCCSYTLAVNFPRRRLRGCFINLQDFFKMWK